MGIGGMLIMIPLASVVYALMREITQRRLEKRGIPKEKLQDQAPEIVSKFWENRQKAKAKKLAKEKKDQKETEEK